MKIKPKGVRAQTLIRAKRKLLGSLKVPTEGLPGSLALTHRRCGKKTCHCAEGRGHELWSLTYMVDGKKRVERIPEQWVEYVRQRVSEGKEFKEGVTQIFAANAELLVLLRKEK